jgi:hypothetical protein
MDNDPERFTVFRVSPSGQTIWSHLRHASLLWVAPAPDGGVYEAGEIDPADPLTKYDFPGGTPTGIVDRVAVDGTAVWSIPFLGTPYIRRMSGLPDGSRVDILAGTTETVSLLGVDYPSSGNVDLLLATITADGRGRAEVYSSAGNTFNDSIIATADATFVTGRFVSSLSPWSLQEENGSAFLLKLSAP